MTAKLRWFWARLDANYWFYPALFVLLALGLAVATLSLDRAGYAAEIARHGPPLAATADSAHTMLQIIAGAMFGTAATVFSITIAAVVFASGNYGPRLLSNFLEDKGNQLSLATLIGTFVYALTVLTSVRIGDEVTGAGGFVPQLSLLVAYGLTAISVGVIVYLLNHIPSSIRINHVLEEIGRRLLRDICERFPALDDGGAEPPEGEQGAPVPSSQTGYVQLIDFDGLSSTAERIGHPIALEVRTGDFLHRGKPLARICGGKADEALACEIEAHFTLGAVRTPEQDLQFLIDELVEIGLRALSPGINDPFTAITATHWLGAGIAELGRRNLARQEGMIGNTRHAIPLPDDFTHFVTRGFGALRGAVATSPIAARIMLEVLADAAGTFDNARRRELLRREADALVAQARTALTGPDLAMVEERHAEIWSRLAGWRGDPDAL